MKLFNHDWHTVSAMFLTGFKGLFGDPVFLLISASGIGVFQVFTYRSDLTIDLAIVTFVAFILMTLLGIVKHWKQGEPDAKEFLIKTIVHLVICVAVVLLGYLLAILLAVVFKFATEAIPGAKVVPSSSMYFIFAGYSIMITYFFIKCCDFIDILIPKLLPKWFSAGIRQFRKTGKYQDLLKVGDLKEEKYNVNGNPN